MAAISIARTDLSPPALREEAARSKDARVARRLLAIAMILDGHSREAAAEACAMDRQTLCDRFIATTKPASRAWPIALIPGLRAVSDQVDTYPW